MMLVLTELPPDMSDNVLPGAMFSGLGGLQRGYRPENILSISEEHIESQWAKPCIFAGEIPYFRIFLLRIFSQMKVSYLPSVFLP